MEKYLVKLEELKEKNKHIYDIISSIDENIQNIKSLPKTIKWTGPAKDKFLLKHDEYMNSLNKMLEILNSCLSVTEKFHENYTEGYHEIVSNVQKVEDEIEEQVELDKYIEYQDDYVDMEEDYG